MLKEKVEILEEAGGWRAVWSAGEREKVFPTAAEALAAVKRSAQERGQVVVTTITWNTTTSIGRDVVKVLTDTR